MEVYEYEVKIYDPQSRDGGLFADYINTFLKLKAQGRGYHSWVRIPEDEIRYVETFNPREGVMMDRDAIRPNAAKRGLVKPCLNSLWGKLAEMQNRTQTKPLSDSQELYRFQYTRGVEVVKLMFASDSVVWVLWRYTAEKQAPSLRHTNEVVAKYVACGVRMHLKAYLDKLREGVVYCDTDSVIFVQKTVEPPMIEYGDALGI